MHPSIPPTARQPSAHAMNANQCLEALAVCREMAPAARQSARKVACDCIDEYMVDAGSDISERQAAIETLMSKFDEQFANEPDEVSIRGYMRRIQRDLGSQADGENIDATT